MDLHLLRSSPAVRFPRRRPFPTPPRRRFFAVSSIFPLSDEKAKYRKEMEAAVEVVERACSLCVDVQRSLFSDKGRILEKNDQTPVTVADFGVQALVSLELGKLFPSIPLVAEEDSSYIRAKNLVDPIVSAVCDKTSLDENSISHADVLEAIDRGVNNAFGTKPATYWILDPIDGTRGFVKGSNALYVILPTGLPMMSKVIKIVHLDWGSLWLLMLAVELGQRDSQPWESLPLSVFYKATINNDDIGDNEIRLVPGCCGSLCKYLMVASGRASVFILRHETAAKAWDHASGMICVHEAGGKVTDWEGSELDLAADQDKRRTIYLAAGVLVTNGNIHHEIVEMISSSSTVV
ncbi:hypothetical protein V6N13_084580 [Hibiscus sabdariffa]